jgi:hypothetical protein
LELIIRENGGREIFYNLLRPRFVSQYHVPLCSDAFSGWIHKPTNENENVRKATALLYEKIIPDFAKTYVCRLYC